jgi:hypothetical protein
MVTRYADLIEAAHENLLTAQARTRHPAAWQSNQILTPYLADLAGALAHLGSTIGDTGAPARDLHTALRALARTDLAPTSPGRGDPQGPALDVAEATIAVRVAVDLIASHGPPLETMTPRQQTDEWASPRPDHLATLTARQGVWAQVAGLAELAAQLTPPDPDPLLTDANVRVAAAAAAVPRRPADPAVQATGPAWPLPLPRRGVPDEWAGRLEEVTALAWRMTLPPGSGRAHPITGLRLLAETGYLLHQQAGHAADDPSQRRALHQRADLWRAIHRQLHCVQTPTEPLMVAQEFALLRTRALAVAALDPGDLRAGIVTWTQAAGWAQPVLSQYLDNPVAGLGPTLTPELRSHLTGHRRLPHRQAGHHHPYEAVLLASLNRAPASPIPPGALDPILALYQAAAQPLTPQPPPGHDQATSRLASVPTTSAAVPAPTAAHNRARGPHQ